MSICSANDSEQSRYLPEPILMDEILIKLPAKSLCRFKAVSKLWNSVISSPQFAKAHFNTHKHLYSRSNYAFFQHDENSLLLDFEAYDNGDIPGDLISLGNKLEDKVNGMKVTPFGSSCGLVCLSVYTQDSFFFLCNPILNQSRLIPPPHPLDTENIILRGFGYVSRIHDFKLIVGLRNRWWDYELMQSGSWGDELRLYLFSLRDNHWRRIVESDDDNSCILARCNQVDQDAILVNERLHWWTNTLQLSNKDGHIFAFDLLQEEFEEIPIPQELAARCSFSTMSYGGLSEIGGCLCLLVHWQKNVELWMLKQYADVSSWTMLYDLHLTSIHRHNLNGFFGSIETGKLLIWGCDESRKRVIFLVDPNQLDPELNLTGNFSTPAVNYVATLMSPFES